MKRLSIVVLCLLTIALSGCSNSVSNYVTAFNENEYEEAYSIFVNSIDGNKKKEDELSIEIESIVEKIKDNYSEGKVTYDRTVSLLNELIRTNISVGEIEKLKVDIEKIRQARDLEMKTQSFLKLIDKKNFLEAIVYFNDNLYGKIQLEELKDLNLYEFLSAVNSGIQSGHVDNDIISNLLDSLSSLKNDDASYEILMSINTFYTNSKNEKLIQEYIDRFNEGNFSQADEIYLNHIKGYLDKEELLEPILQDKGLEAIDSYLMNLFSYDRAMRNLNELMKTEITNDFIEEAINDINYVKKARECLVTIQENHLFQENGYHDALVFLNDLDSLDTLYDRTNDELLRVKEEFVTFIKNSQFMTVDIQENTNSTNDYWYGYYNVKIFNSSIYVADMFEVYYFGSGGMSGLEKYGVRELGNDGLPPFYSLEDKITKNYSNSKISKAIVKSVRFIDNNGDSFDWTNPYYDYYYDQVFD